MDKELHNQLKKYLSELKNKEHLAKLLHKDQDLSADEDSDSAMNQLQSLIKTEPGDSDDDCYYVLVVDQKDGEDESPEPAPEEAQPEPEEAPEILPVKVQIKPERLEVPETQSIILNESENFVESSIESYTIADKVPANVPATILENEEESQDNDEERFNDDMNIDENPEYDQDNSQDRQTFILEGYADSQDKSNDSNMQMIITGDSFQDTSNNLVQLMTTTGRDGTIVIKGANGEKITYVPDMMNDDDNDEDDPMSQEVIFCEGDDSSLQIIKCDANELVIEYDDDGQIATVLQQEDGSFLCECGESFHDLGEYEKHQSTHNPNGDHLCNLCGKGFESAEILKGHMILHNVSGLLVMCPICGMLFKRSVLTQHIKFTHSNIKPQCKLCNKTFANPNNLKRHMMIHEGIKEYECDICLKRFHQKITMQTHRLTHINPLACSQCDDIFNSTTELNEHKETDQCSKSKIMKVKMELLKTIKQEVTTNSGKVVGFACSLCQKMFSVESALEQHVENMHMVNPLELLCPECGEVQPSKKEMQHHLASHKFAKSKSIKRFECETCGKACTSQAMLLMHERVHTNERPFACQLCTLRFKTKTHLRTHQLTHTRERKFGCSICMKFFALKGNLVVHLRTHTGERPYVCSLCDEAFIDSKYLKKHKVKKHSIDNVPWNQY